MPFRRHAGWITTQPDMVRPGCDAYVQKFPSVYGDGRSRVQVDHGPVDLSQEYEANDAYNITPVDSWGLYDFSDDFHDVRYTTLPNRHFHSRR
mgnify:CR=1 FL=1